MSLWHDCKTQNGSGFTANEEFQTQIVRKRKIFAGSLKIIPDIDDTLLPPSPKSNLIPRILLWEKDLTCVGLMNKQNN